MKRITIIATIIAVVLSSFSAMTYAQKKSSNNIETELNMFPAPKLGYKQVYIKLPAKKNEQDYKVEFYVGKKHMADCNRHFLVGEIQEMNLEGWGYNYYMVESKGHIGSTMMACLDKKKTEKFIHLQPQLVRYNSKLPIVIYLPDNMEVQYKIWKGDKKMKTAPVSPIAPLVDRTIENKRWQLVELNGQAIESAAETHYLIFHSDNNRIEAKANCNIIMAEYESKNEFQVRFSHAATTRMACPDNFENQFLEMLSQVDNYTINEDGTALSLNKARMAPLARFELVIE